MVNLYDMENVKDGLIKLKADGLSLRLKVCYRLKPFTESRTAYHLIPSCPC
ncbi:MAG: hypothetical protein SVY10_05230 [Thermodesulfobacteriota bacterium]|nr:hypothetical protein [Thermodesulfobacteriota bacterium]